MNQMAAELARTVRVAENRQAFQTDGMTSTQSWLRGHCRLSRSSAGQVVSNGRALELLPAVAAAHAAGEVTADQVALIAKITQPRCVGLIEQQDGDLTGIGAVLAGFAAPHKHDELARGGDTLLDPLDPGGPQPQPPHQRLPPD